MIQHIAQNSDPAGQQQDERPHFELENWLEDWDKKETDWSEEPRESELESGDYGEKKKHVHCGHSGEENEAHENWVDGKFVGWAGEPCQVYAAAGHAGEYNCDDEPVHHMCVSGLHSRIVVHHHSDEHQ